MCVKDHNRLQRFFFNLKVRYSCLEEIWQRGYSCEYRWFRLKEAFYPLFEKNAGDKSE